MFGPAWFGREFAVHARQRRLHSAVLVELPSAPLTAHIEDTKSNRLITTTALDAQEIALGLERVGSLFANEKGVVGC